MQLEAIKNISEDDIELFQTLSSGYLRSLDTEGIVACLKQNIFTQYAKKVYRAFQKCDDFSEHINDVSEYLLGLLHKDMSYREVRRIACFLSMMLGHCSNPIKIRAWEAFISSEKRSIRKYAYQISAEIIGSKRLDKAWEIADSHTDEVIFLAPTVLDTVSQNQIPQWRDRILGNAHIPDSIKRKFFRRKELLENEDFEFLRNNMPRTYLYECAMRQEIVDDKICHDLYNAEMDQKEPWLRMDIKTFSHYMGKPDYDGLLLWCFAKMGKWDLIQIILKESKNNEN